jgi:23S rRNA (adenine2030-N6)-methyltransferase
MNYRHEFHAGNFADVLKHVFLVRILLYLRRKEKPFRYIDTHAGAGLYDLNGPDAARSGEAREGILRLLENPNHGADSSGSAWDLLEPYLAAVRAAGGPQIYPGSPLIAKSLLRPQDKAIFCEMLPRAAQSLRRANARDDRVKTIEIDGYTGLKAFTPPPERRGLVLIDPPFERRDEYERIFDTLNAALKKWPDGIFMIWQPVKEPDVVASFCRAVAAAAPKSLRIDLQVETPAPNRPLARTGLIVINPPYVLEQEAQILLPLLTQILARGPGAQFSLQPLSGEDVPHG